MPAIGLILRRGFLAVANAVRRTETARSFLSIARRGGATSLNALDNMIRSEPQEQEKSQALRYEDIIPFLKLLRGKDMLFWGTVLGLGAILGVFLLNLNFIMSNSPLADLP